MWSKRGIDGSGLSIAFYGDKGTVIIDSKSRRAEDGLKGGGSAKVERQAARVNNFLDCIESREAPHAEIEIGHASTRLCHIANIAHRVGKTLTFDDAKTESFPTSRRRTSSSPESAAAGLRYPRRSDGRIARRGSIGPWNDAWVRRELDNMDLLVDFARHCRKKSPVRTALGNPGICQVEKRRRSDADSRRTDSAPRSA